MNEAAQHLGTCQRALGKEVRLHRHVWASRYAPFSPLTVRGCLATAGTLLGCLPEPAFPLAVPYRAGLSPSRSDPAHQAPGSCSRSFLIAGQRCCEGTAARIRVCYLERVGSK